MEMENWKYSGVTVVNVVVIMLRLTSFALEYQIFQWHISLFGDVWKDVCKDIRQATLSEMHSWPLLMLLLLLFVFLYTKMCYNLCKNSWQSSYKSRGDLYFSLQIRIKSQYSFFICLFSLFPWTFQTVPWCPDLFSSCLLVMLLIIVEYWFCCAMAIS